MTQEEKLNAIANRRFKTDYKYLGSEYARSEVLMDYAIDIERELSSKSQECEDLKTAIDALDKRRVQIREECNAELDSLRAERDKWKEDCIHNANRALEIVAERDKWHVLADEHSATALEFSDSLRDVRAENERLNTQLDSLKQERRIYERQYHGLVTENDQLKSDLYHSQSNLEIAGKRCEDLEAALDVETNNAVDRGKKVVELTKTIEKAYDWLKNPGVPIQPVINLLRKSKEKLLSQ